MRCRFYSEKEGSCMCYCIKAAVRDEESLLLKVEERYFIADWGEQLVAKSAELQVSALVNDSAEIRKLVEHLWNQKINELNAI